MVIRGTTVFITFFFAWLLKLLLGSGDGTAAEIGSSYFLLLFTGKNRLEERGLSPAGVRHR